MTKILSVLLLVFAWTSALAANEVDATAGAHAHDSPVPTPAASTAPRRAVTGKEVVYGRDGESELRGYLARPVDAGPETPGLIVIHEWWGLNDNIRQTAERLAGEGYVALAVDLYGGQSASIPKEAIKLMNGLMANTDRADENLRQAHRYLDQEIGAPRVGSIGWCLGGRWSLRTAVLLPDSLDAAVMYYGTVTTDETDLEPLQLPVMGNFAERDPIIPLESVEQFTATMQRLGKVVDVKVYAGAKHAFANPSGMDYNAVAAEDAWERSTTFLSTYLQSD
jgi:carboxymethylenebutenolidase